MSRAGAALVGTIAILWAVASFAGDAPSAAADPISARAFAVRFKSVSDAAEVISPVLSPQGSVTLQPRLKSLTVQDHVSVLDRIAALLQSFDIAPRNVEISLSLFLGTDRREQEAGRVVPPVAMTRDVRGVAETLGDFTKWNSYEPLGGRAVTAAEGGRVTVNLSEEYRVVYDVEAVLDQSVKLTNFVLQRLTRGADGRERV